MLERACDACATGAFGALVTAPVQKAVINDAGMPFSGHTEYLAAGTHRPRRDDAGGRPGCAWPWLPRTCRWHVPAAISGALLDETLDILQHDLVARSASHRRASRCWA